MKGLANLNYYLFIFAILLEKSPPVAPAISNKYMTFYIPEYARRYIYLEGKFSYSVQLVLHKGDPAHNVGVGATNATLTDPVEFIIKAPEYSYYGIVAIIQSLHLRTNSFSTDNDGCRDYIQFSAESKSSELEPSPKICGKLLRGDEQAQPTGLKGPRTYFNPKGNIKLSVHVNSAVSHMDFSELNTIGAEIVFTAYTSCPETDVGLKTLRSCSSQASLHSCIPSALFCDSKIDCGFPEEFGVDEQQCYFPYLYLALAVIAILVVILIIFAFIHWVRVKTKTWAENAESRYTDNGDGGGGADMNAACDMDMGAAF